ncbi:hypothetical protein GCM10022226_80780 [Sphaerisporangium flaviroseum]|uniref:Secreted protein n=1 Tax=Sphaerisporangium flaviroseum TaxID=509199 RepID=A0ABP7JIL3_9ACTN
MRITMPRAASIRRSGALALTAIATGVLLWPVAAQAATGSELGTPVAQTDTSRGLPPGITSALPVTFTAGDCRQFGNGTTDSLNSSVRLDRPDANGNSRVTWVAHTATRKTSNADIWHANFVFKTAFGTRILTTGTFDSVPMTAINFPYATVRSAPVRVDPALFFAITQVDWFGDC